MTATAIEEDRHPLSIRPTTASLARAVQPLLYAVGVLTLLTTDLLSNVLVKNMIQSTTTHRHQQLTEEAVKENTHTCPRPVQEALDHHPVLHGLRLLHPVRAVVLLEELGCLLTVITAILPLFREATGRLRLPADGHLTHGVVMGVIAMRIHLDLEFLKNDISFRAS
jgi:hypothetical protein